jgi:hypothetical protein
MLPAGKNLSRRLVVLTMIFMIRRHLGQDKSDLASCPIHRRLMPPSSCGKALPARATPGLRFVLLRNRDTNR